MSSSIRPWSSFAQTFTNFRELLESSIPSFGVCCCPTLTEALRPESRKSPTYLMTPLVGADGEIYAIAQGPLSVGGFSAQGGGTSVAQNHPTVGMLVGGAIVEREVAYSGSHQTSLFGDRSANGEMGESEASLRQSFAVWKGRSRCLCPLIRPQRKREFSGFGSWARVLGWSAMLTTTI